MSPGLRSREGLALSLRTPSMPPSSSHATDAWLESSEGRVYSLEKDCAIGRIADNHVVLPMGGVSRHHARISASRNGTFTLVDLESTNGTYLNGSRIIAPSTLNDGDVVGVGEVRFRFRLRTAAAADATDTSPRQPARRVLVVGQASVIGDGLLRLLAAAPAIEVAARAEDAGQARQLYAQLRPELVLIDTASDAVGATSLIQDLHAIDERTPMVMLFERADSDLVERVIRAGACACVLKTDPAEELMRGLSAASEGELYLSRRLAALTLRTLARADSAGPRDGPRGLSDREREIFHLVGAGRPNREIALVLGMSVKTVETHKENMKVKLGLPSARDLAAKARAWTE
ncbi:MAG TPA: FHA domain-containing protein [Opitutaceae bacterium]|nr:FHA domain-containing protein [Opitutaceae bacterium]